MGGSLTENEIDDILTNPVYKDQIGNFVETGTYKGESTMVCAKMIKNVYTIEICEELYHSTKNDLLSKGYTNIEFILGDSLVELDGIMKKVEENNMGSIFFIDAHISGMDSSWNKVERVPLVQELNIILKYKIKPSVFIIDDLRLWKQKCWDWSHITNEVILSQFEKHKVNVWMSFEKDDRFYILTI